jgi:hypothetical protein
MQRMSTYVSKSHAVELCPYVASYSPTQTSSEDGTATEPGFESTFEPWAWDDMKPR